MIDKDTLSAFIKTIVCGGKITKTEAFLGHMVFLYQTFLIFNDVFVSPICGTDPLFICLQFVFVRMIKFDVK